VLHPQAAVSGDQLFEPSSALILRSHVPLDTAVKKEILTEYATSEGDTGSPEVQIALATGYGH